jgi:hypothetical protein
MGVRHLRRSVPDQTHGESLRTTTRGDEVSEANQCQCGRPAQVNLCTTCGEDLRDNLHKIAARWPELEKALTTPNTGGEKGRTKHGMIAVGTNLNEAAVAARRACTDAVWFTLQVIRDDLDDMGKPFRPPRLSPNRSQDDTPTLAGWIATWHIGHITHKTARESAEEIARDVAAAERRTFALTEKDRDRKIPTGMPCENHGTSDMGERVPCTGSMVAELSEQMPDLVCDQDASHRIPPDVWSRSYWKAKHHMEGV